MRVHMPVILLTEAPLVLGSVHLDVSRSNHKSMSVFGKACLNVSRSTDKGNWSFYKCILSLPLGLSTEIFQDVEVWGRLSLCLIVKIPVVLWNVSSDISRCSLVSDLGNMWSDDSTSTHQYTCRLVRLMTWRNMFGERVDLHPKATPHSWSACSSRPQIAFTALRIVFRALLFTALTIIAASLQRCLALPEENQIISIWHLIFWIR
jgi:hypothetical protein